MSDPIPLSSDDLTLLPTSLYESLRTRAGTWGLSAARDVLVFETNLMWFLVHLHRLGGHWEVLSDLVEWECGAEPNDSQMLADLAAVDSGFVLGVGSGCQEIIEHATGVFRLVVGSSEVLAVSVRTGPRHGHHTRRFVALTGASRKALAAFYQTLRAAARTRRLTTWSASGVPRRLRLDEVREEEVILPAALKEDLLSWLDRFWKLRDLASIHNLPIRRGLLLVGAPGTGKTTLLRHLLSRYGQVDAHVFIPAKRSTGVHSGFETMLTMVGSAGREVIVVLEDIDRLAESDTVTAAGLLNHLDGLLTLDVPAMWIATTNDPLALDRTLLDRPGRFDRTIVLPLPGPSERGLMLRRYSKQELDQATMDRAVSSSQGMTGAHLREVCVSATLSALDTGAAYNEVLLTEIHRVLRERDAAREAGRALEHQRSVGFART